MKTKLNNFDTSMIKLSYQKLLELNSTVQVLRDYCSGKNDMNEVYKMVYILESMANLCCEIRLDFKNLLDTYDIEIDESTQYIEGILDNAH